MPGRRNRRQRPQTAHHRGPRHQPRHSAGVTHVLGGKKLGLEQSLGSRLVIYADDLVVLCRRGNAEAALHYLRELMGKLKLTVNEEKTRICKVPGKASSTFWGSHSDGGIRREPARLAWHYGHR